MSPVVWSTEGPVPEEGVFPLCRVQLNLSSVPCSKPHKDTSKLHVNSRWRQWGETNEYSRYLLNWLEMLLEPVHFRLLYFQSRWLSLFGVVSRWVFSLAVLFLRLIFYHLLIGVPKTKITSSNSACCLTIQGYEFEYVHTPLASGGVAMFIYETLSCFVLQSEFYLIKFYSQKDQSTYLHNWLQFHWQIHQLISWLLFPASHLSRSFFGLYNWSSLQKLLGSYYVLWVVMVIYMVRRKIDIKNIYWNFNIFLKN